MIIVTGGAGFIGSRLVKALNQRAYDNILVVDDLSNGKQCLNLADCRIADYIDKHDFLKHIENRHFSFDRVEAIFHQGACSATTEWDGAYLMKNNYAYSKQLLQVALKQRIPFIYASSAAVYGKKSSRFSETPTDEAPINAYAYSKLLFDQYVRRQLPHARSQVVGLRYFNVYGPGEAHKGPMASVAFHLFQQIHSAGEMRLFEGTEGYADGEQSRDFIYVDDAVAVNLWFLDNSEKSGIFNVGTGSAEPFNHIAKAWLQYYPDTQLKYIPFPVHLKGHYQSFTQADITRLREIGCPVSFRDVAAGVKAYRKELITE